MHYVNCFGIICTKEQKYMFWVQNIIMDSEYELIALILTLYFSLLCVLCSNY